MSIWIYKQIVNNVNLPNNIRVTLGEGNTKNNLIKLKNDSSLYVKREDQNPSGSWKDRGTALKISSLVNKSYKEAVISSSGNAAISFLKYTNKIGNFRMHIVVSPEINEDKKKIIKELIKIGNHKLYFSKQAKRKASKLAAENMIPNLKSSIDETIIKGYWSLGLEIYRDIIRKNRGKNFILFCPVSSGTAAIGLIQGLQLKIDNELNMPQVFFLQTQSCHPLMSDIEIINEKSLADAIVDKSLIRKPMLEKILNQTNGKSFSITNKELKSAKEYAVNHGINLSYTSLLSIAGFLRVNNSFKNTVFITIASGR